MMISAAPTGLEVCRRSMSSFDGNEVEDHRFLALGNKLGAASPSPRPALIRFYGRGWGGYL